MNNQNEFCVEETDIYPKLVFNLENIQTHKILLQTKQLHKKIYSCFLQRQQITANENRELTTQSTVSNATQFCPVRLLQIIWLNYKRPRAWSQANALQVQKKMMSHSIVSSTPNVITNDTDESSRIIQTMENTMPTATSDYKSSNIDAIPNIRHMPSTLNTISNSCALIENASETTVLTITAVPSTTISSTFESTSIVSDK